MKIESFIEAGFVLTLDPEFVVEYELAEATEDSEKAVISYSIVKNSFCIITPFSQEFIYFNAESPELAIQWASVITQFEPNY